jgi:hypothetical protein
MSIKEVGSALDDNGEEKYFCCMISDFGHELRYSGSFGSECAITQKSAVLRKIFLILLIKKCLLAPADFFLFRRLKTIMKGARFVDVAAIQERVTAVLRSIPKETFAEAL